MATKTSVEDWESQDDNIIESYWSTYTGNLKYFNSDWLHIY